MPHDGTLYANNYHLCEAGMWNQKEKKKKMGWWWWWWWWCGDDDNDEMVMMMWWWWRWGSDGDDVVLMMWWWWWWWWSFGDDDVVMMWWWCGDDDEVEMVMRWWWWWGGDAVEVVVMVRWRWGCVGDDEEVVMMMRWCLFGFRGTRVPERCCRVKKLMRAVEAKCVLLRWWPFGMEKQKIFQTKKAAEAISTLPWRVKKHFFVFGKTATCWGTLDFFFFFFSKLIKFVSNLDVIYAMIVFEDRMNWDNQLLRNTEPISY